MSIWEEKLVFFSTMQNLVEEIKSVSQKCRDLEQQIEHDKEYNEKKLAKMINEQDIERTFLLCDLDFLKKQLKLRSIKITELEEKLREETARSQLISAEAQEAMEKIEKENNDLKSAIESLKEECTANYENARAAEERERQMQEHCENLHNELERLKEENRKLEEQTRPQFPGYTLETGILTEGVAREGIKSTELESRENLLDTPNEQEVETNEEVESEDDSDACSDESDSDESDVEEPEARNDSPEPDSDDYSVSYCDVTDSDATDDSFEVPDIEGDDSAAEDAKEEEKGDEADKLEPSENLEESVPAHPVTEENVEAAGDDIKPISNEKFEHFLGQYRLVEFSAKKPNDWLRNVKLTATSEGVEWIEWGEANPSQTFSIILIDSEFAENRVISEKMKLATFRSSDCFDTDICTFYKAHDRTVMFQKYKPTGEFVAYCAVSDQ